MCNPYGLFLISAHAHAEMGTHLKIPYLYPRSVLSTQGTCSVKCSIDVKQKVGLHSSNKVHICFSIWCIQHHWGCSIRVGLPVSYGCISCITLPRNNFWLFVLCIYTRPGAVSLSLNWTKSALHYFQ